MLFLKLKWYQCDPQAQAPLREGQRSRLQTLQSVMSRSFINC